MIEHIREMGRNKILERVNAYKNNEHMPEDILSTILSNYSNYIVVRIKLGLLIANFRKYRRINLTFEKKIFAIKFN